MATTTEIFESITERLLANSNVSNLISIVTISIPKTECQSSSPCPPNSFTILNFTNKKITTCWFDYSGIASESVAIPENVQSSITLGTFANHCFSVIIDPDGPDSETYYIRIPEKETVCYVGDSTIFLKKISDSSWLNNPDLSIKTLEEYKTLVDYEPLKQTHSDFALMRSSYYDDSDEFKNLLQKFFSNLPVLGLVRLPKSF